MEKTVTFDRGPTFGQRYVQIFLVFICIVVNLIVRLNTGIAVVAMTNAKTTNPDFPEYHWTEMEKSYILSSFFWSYLITQFPGGILCKRYGAKLVLSIATFGSSVITILLPFTIDWGGWQMYCFIRVVQGLFQGLIFPCIHSHFAVWCPLEERTRMCALGYTGNECGTLLAMYMGGMIAASSMGWPGISYISCALGVFCSALIFIFTSNSPSESKYITQAEKSYIENSNKSLREHSVNRKSIPVPWKAILCSWAFWALLLNRTAFSWSISTLMAEIPHYMNAVLGMDMKSNAVFSALPFLAMWCMSYIYIILAEILNKRQILTLNALRKTFNSLAFWIPAIGLILIGFVKKEQKTLAIVLMTINVGFSSGVTIGSSFNTIDLSPNHAGILMGISNCIGNLMPMLTPLVVGLIVHDESDRTQWQIVFAISAAVFFFANLFYIFFGSTKLQPWDAENYNKEGNNVKLLNKPVEEN